MKVVKGLLKNTAVLRSLTNLQPEVGNATRWTSWGSMVIKYQRIRDHLITGSEMDDTNYEMDTSMGFRRKCEAVKQIFEDINMVAVSMQTKLYMLSQCRSDLNALLAEMDEGNISRASGWFGHKFDGTYITPDSSKLPDPSFVSGVVKIQENNQGLMSPEEKEACKDLLLEEDEQNSSQSSQPSLAQRMIERMKKRKAGVMENNLGSPFKNCDFICGSAAEVERLWSIAKHVLTNTRSRLTPVMFETLIFSKVNEDYWDLATVQSAHTLARRGATTEEIKSMMSEDEGFGDNYSLIT